MLNKQVLITHSLFRVMSVLVSVNIYTLQMDRLRFIYFWFATGIQDQRMGKKRQETDLSTSAEPSAKRKKTDTTEPAFSHVRFKFLLRSPDTVITGRYFIGLSVTLYDSTHYSGFLFLLFFAQYES